jgi:Fe(3+) dicitrate transport protein
MSARIRRHPALPLLIAALAPGAGLAADNVSAPRVDIIGHKENLDRIPGSAYTIDRDTLESTRVFTTNEALRKIPGINARDEEGMGLRPNIGIRGLNPTRSTKLTLLEDGIPLSYAPYGDNATYYHPPIERFDRIEVLKGAGQVLYGPQTVGGVINYVTPTPPQDFRGSIALSSGNRGFFNARAQLGGDGFLLDLMRKHSDGARNNTHSELSDVNLKKVVALGGQQAVTLRLSHYVEESRMTYSGITDAEYRNFGARYNPFRNDYFDAQRTGASATHDVTLAGGAKLTTNLYYATFSRDWWRQASTTTDSQCAGFTAARGAGTAVNPDACGSIQGRLRDYTQYGIEPRVRVDHAALGVASELDAGLRLHREEQKRLQVNGTSASARAGTLAEDNLRETTAMAAFAQNRFLLGNLTISPGLRYEHIDNTRTNRLTNASGSTSLGQFIPSLGATWKYDATTTIFGGVHRGFAPPRTEDLINSNATFTDVGAEKSWNWEAGVRAAPMRGLDMQATAFRNDFQRLISVGSIAGGNTPLSQGEALFQGVEIAGRYGDPGGFYSTAALTWLPTAEQSTVFTQVANPVLAAGNSAAGNRLPYAPRKTATIGVGYLHASGLDVNVEAVHVGAQFSDFGNVADAASDARLTATEQQSGQFGRISAFTVFNATANYNLPQYKLTLFLTVKNLADKVYIVDRTRGILPGAPRLIQAGLRWDF